MKAMLSRVAGPPESLELADVEVPAPKDGEVLIRVAACGVNFPDALIIEDRYQFRPERPFAPGGEVSGTIEAVGAGVTGLSPGTRVLASVGWGGMAEEAVTRADRCVAIPENMPFDEAAAFLMTYGTSYHALVDRGGLKPGHTVLVLGAGGGVGTAAVEIAKALGARVVAACSSADKLKIATECGADAGIVYPHGPFGKDGARQLADLFKAACGPGGADVVYDAVGGDYSEAALRAIAWEGRFLVVGFPAGIARIPLNLALLKGCEIAGVFWGDFIRRNPARHAANVLELLVLYEKGQIRPRISKRFALAEAPKAIAWLASRQAVGKVVVVVAAS